MKLTLKMLAKFLQISCMLFCGLSVVHAHGCNFIDKNKLAETMAIDKSLIPFLSLEIPSCANINLAEGYAGFVLNEQNEKVNNGVRSEIAINYPFVEGETVEYRWSILVPKDSALGGDDRQWWLIAQWHDQPNYSAGQTWATYKGQPPPVAIHTENRNGIIGIGLAGIQGKKLSWAPVPMDEWLNLKVVIHWSTKEDGSVNLSVEGHPELTFVSSGRNMLNSYQHYFKAGQYRAPSVNKYSVINIKNIQFKKLAQQVGN